VCVCVCVCDCMLYPRFLSLQHTGHSPHQPVGDINLYRRFLYPRHDALLQSFVLGKPSEVMANDPFHSVMEVTGGKPMACPFHAIMAQLRNKKHEGSGDKSNET